MVDYFKYELELCESIVMPLFSRLNLDLAGKSVLDAGCGHGGVIAGLSSGFSLGEAIGLDRDEKMLDSARSRRLDKIEWLQADFLSYSGKTFDLVLLRDVLEHIGDVKGALRKTFDLLKPGGSAYVTFAPFYSPFGGHQHNGEGLGAYLPWVHLLPEGLFRRLLRLPGNSYKTGDKLREDIDSVFATKLSLRSMARELPSLPWEVEYRAYYFSRPDYRLKFGMPSVCLPSWTPLPLAELATTGAEFLLRKKA